MNKGEEDEYICYFQISGNLSAFFFIVITPVSHLCTVVCSVLLCVSPFCIYLWTTFVFKTDCFLLSDCRVSSVSYRIVSFLFDFLILTVPPFGFWIFLLLPMFRLLTDWTVVLALNHCCVLTLVLMIQIKICAMGSPLIFIIFDINLLLKIFYITNEYVYIIKQFTQTVVLRRKRTIISFPSAVSSEHHVTISV